MALGGGEGLERGPRGGGLGAAATRSRGTMPGGQCQVDNASPAAPGCFSASRERGRDNERRGDCKHGPVSMAA